MGQIKAKIILDSLSPSGKRLTTMELTYPRFIHAEFMTHRAFSRNAASSRAIPIKDMIEMVKENPAMPVFWGKNKRGMSPVKEIEDVEAAKKIWLEARDKAVAYAEWLNDLNVHKQIVNRVLEPWKLITVICTATEWSNFFALRDHQDAQQEIAELAKKMRIAMDTSIPQSRIIHTPYLTKEDITEIWYNTNEEIKAFKNTCSMISVARCARVSYLTHDGKRDHEKDLTLYDRLLTGSGHGHWSPFEHVAFSLDDPNERSGNFIGWKQYRKTFSQECQ
jgi:thymidylate synthase ThyX